MNKKIIIGIFIVVLGLAPFGVKSVFDKLIEKNKVELKSNGIDVSINNIQGYLTTNREFTFTISDELKLKKLMQNPIVSNYIISISAILGGNVKVEDFFKGTVLKGTIENSNINPFSDIKVYAYVNKLSDNFMNIIKEEDEVLYKSILSFIEKKALAFNMEFDNQSKLKTFALKDIDEKFKILDKFSEREAALQVLGYKIVKKSSKEEIIANINFDKLYFGVSDKKFLLNNLKYDINYKDELLNGGTMKIENIDFQETDMGINLSNIFLTSKTSINNELYTGISEIRTKEFKISADDQKVFYLDNFNLKTFVDLNYNKYKNFYKAYKKFQAKEHETRELSDYSKREAIIKEAFDTLFKEITSLLNSGLSFKINKHLLGLDVDSFGLLPNRLKLRELNLDLDIKLDENSLIVSNIPDLLSLFSRQEFLSLFDAKIDLETQEEDYKNIIAILSKIFPPSFLDMILKYAKKQNSKVKFDFLFQKGNLKEINGEKLE